MVAARLIGARAPAAAPGGADPPVPSGGEAAEMVGRVRRALSLLRDAGSADELVERVPFAVSTLGFDRVVYARLHGTRWTPASSCGPRAPGSAARVLDETVPEHVAAERSRPVLVHEASAGRLLPRSWCTCYVAVPVVERGVVVGLLHAGRAGALPPPSALDRDVLWTVGEALGAAFASARAVEALRDLLARMGAVADGLTGPAVPRPPRPAAAAPLTSREREVLELMAAGRTNAQIARRLVITEGTAKSHVKHIMRKLRAANRAEAVAAWVRTAHH